MQRLRIVAGRSRENLMAARSIASLTLSFGLVSIPVKLYSATDSAAGVGFNLLTPDGGRVKQRYISEATGDVVARADMKKGYEFEKGQFVVFAPDELKALEEGASHVVEIVSFVPEKSVDPLYYDKAYFIAPDKRGGKHIACYNRPCEKANVARWQNGHTRERPESFR
jgi:DNA end-binding protein Ku